MSVEVQPRKRKDKKKKRAEEGLRQDDLLEHSSVNGKGDDDLLVRDDSEDRNQVEEHDSHHGPNAGWGAKVIFFVVFAGLIAAMGSIVFQLKGSEITDIPIKESRYASILENFVEEHTADDHDEVVSHGSDEDEHEHDEGDIAEHPPDHEGVVAEPEQADLPQADEHREPEIVEGVVLEPSMPDEIELPEPETDEFEEEGEEGLEEEYEEKQEESEEMLDLPDEEDTSPEVDDSATLPESAEPEENIQEDELPRSEEESTEASLEDHPTETIPDLQEQEEPIARSYYEDDTPDEQPQGGEVDDDQSEEEENDHEETTEAESEDGGILEGLFESMFSHIDTSHEETGKEEERGDSDEITKSDSEFIAQDVSVGDGDGDVGGTDEDETPYFDENVDIPIREDPEIAHESTEIEGDESGSEETDEVDEETQKEYIKIIDEVLREHQKQESDARASYPAAAITNDYDFEFRKEIDDANKLLEKAPDKAVVMFSSILEKYPKSPRALYGKAMAMDRLSDVHKSNSILEQSIYAYRDVLDLPDVPDNLFKLSAFRCVDRMRFRGFHSKAIKVLDRMLKRFPKSVEILNQKAVTYLVMGKNKNAKETLEETLNVDPNSGFAKVHYGFILKIEENDIKRSIKYLKEGIATEEPGTVDGRFYFQLGDALVRDNKSDEAYKVYESGVKKGLFLSVYQRSLYNVKSLRAVPWWKSEQTTYQHYLKLLEDNWKVIRDEAVPLISDENQGYFPESEGLRNKGMWKQFEMFARGRKITQNCARTPKTCSLIDSMPDAAGCKRGQVKFSLLMPGTRVWPHTGPTNCRLRTHLGLVVPEGAGIRVANETRVWREGRVMIFDDSFEHEVWHEGKSYRLVLIVDFWHPDLTEAQKQALPPI